MSGRNCGSFHLGFDGELVVRFRDGNGDWANLFRLTGWTENITPDSLISNPPREEPGARSRWLHETNLRFLRPQRGVDIIVADGISYQGVRRLLEGVRTEAG